MSESNCLKTLSQWKSYQWIAMALIKRDWVQTELKASYERPTHRLKPFKLQLKIHKALEVAELKLGCDSLTFDEISKLPEQRNTTWYSSWPCQPLGVDAPCHPSPRSGLLQRIGWKPNDHSLSSSWDGSGQHPSQSLLDLMTTYQELVTLMVFGKFVPAGDLDHLHVWQNQYANLGKRLGANPYFAGPDEWEVNLKTMEVSSLSMKSLRSRWWCSL